MASMYTYDDLLSALRGAGICEGDDVFIHSNIGFFGRLNGVSSSQELCDRFIQAMQEVLGPKGTLVLPTFTYSFCHGEIFDPNTTVSQCGMLPERMRTRPGALRSGDPNFSVVAEGENAAFYTGTWSHEAFGDGSFWEKLLSKNGRIACFNFDCGSTFVHYVEHLSQVPYRYNKAFNGIRFENDRMIRDYAVHYVYDLDCPQDSPCFSRLDTIVRRQSFCKIAPLGRGEMLSFPAKDYMELIVKTLKTRPRFLTWEEGNE